MKYKKGELIETVCHVRDKCTLLFPCEWEKEEWNVPPVKIGDLSPEYLG